VIPHGVADAAVPSHRGTGRGPPAPTTPAAAGHSRSSAPAHAVDSSRAPSKPRRAEHPVPARPGWPARPWICRPIGRIAGHRYDCRPRRVAAESSPARRAGSFLSVQAAYRAVERGDHFDLRAAVPPRRAAGTCAITRIHVSCARDSPAQMAGRRVCCQAIMRGSGAAGARGVTSAWRKSSCVLESRRSASRSAWWLAR